MLDQTGKGAPPRRRASRIFKVFQTLYPFFSGFHETQIPGQPIKSVFNIAFFIFT